MILRYLRRGVLFNESRGWGLSAHRFGELDRFLARAAKTGHELRAYADALDFIAGQRDAEHRSCALNSLFPRGADDVTVKK